MLFSRSRLLLSCFNNAGSITPSKSSSSSARDRFPSVLRAIAARGRSRAAVIFSKIDATAVAGVEREPAPRDLRDWLSAASSYKRSTICTSSRRLPMKQRASNSGSSRTLLRKSLQRCNSSGCIQTDAVSMIDQRTQNLSVCMTCLPARLHASGCSCTQGPPITLCEVKLLRVLREMIICFVASVQSGVRMKKKEAQRNSKAYFM